MPGGSASRKPTGRSPYSGCSGRRRATRAPTAPAPTISARRPTQRPRAGQPLQAHTGDPAAADQCDGQRPDVRERPGVQAVGLDVDVGDREAHHRQRDRARDRRDPVEDGRAQAARVRAADEEDGERHGREQQQRPRLRQRQRLGGPAQRDDHRDGQREGVDHRPQPHPAAPVEQPREVGDRAASGPRPEEQVEVDGRRAGLAVARRGRRGRRGQRLLGDLGLLHAKLPVRSRARGGCGVRRIVATATAATTPAPRSVNRTSPPEKGSPPASDARAAGRSGSARQPPGGRAPRRSRCPPAGGWSSWGPTAWSRSAWRAPCPRTPPIAWNRRTTTASPRRPARPRRTASRAQPGGSGRPRPCPSRPSRCWCRRHRRPRSASSRARPGRLPQGPRSR